MRKEDIVRATALDPEPVAAGTSHPEPAGSMAREPDLPAAALNFYSARIEPDPHLQPPITVSGPSFLGLSGAVEPLSPYSYLDEDEPPESHARSIVLLLVLAVLAGVVYWNWQPIRNYVVNVAIAPWQQGRLLPTAAPTEPASTTASSDNAAPPPVPTANPDGLPQQTSATTADPPKPEAAPAIESAPKEREKPAARPVAQPAGAELVDSGERYLYGRGVPRNCSQALVNFNASARQDNPRAMSHLGSLYATGQCVPLDRAQAYQWFSRALSLDRSNKYLEHNLNMIWIQMSSEERARATQKRTF